MAVLPLQSVIGLSLLSLAPMITLALSRVETTTKDGAETKVVLSAVTIVFMTFGGLFLHFMALTEQKAQRSGMFALLAANAGLAYHLFYEGTGAWEDAMLCTLFPAYGGLLLGTLGEQGAGAPLGANLGQSNTSSKVEASVKALQEEVKLLKESCDAATRKLQKIENENMGLKERIERAWDQE